MGRISAALLRAWIWLCLAASGAGAGWEVVPSGTQDTLCKIFFIDPRTGFIVGNHGTLLATQDGGKSWARRGLPYAEDLLSVWFTDARRGFACGSGGLILRSSDTGRTWEKIPTPTASALTDIAFADAATGFAAGYADSILVSRDSGATWSAQPLPSGVLRLSKTLDFPTASDGYLVAINNIYKTRDAGRTWEGTAFRPGSAFLSEAYFFGADTGFIADTNFGSLLMTTDGMRSFSAVIRETINRVHFLDRKVGYAWGTKCYRTGDGGEHWAQDSAFDSKQWGSFGIRDLASAGSQAVLMVGGSGFIARKEEDPGASTALNRKGDPQAFSQRWRAAFRADGRRNAGRRSPRTPAIRFQE